MTTVARKITFFKNVGAKKQTIESTAGTYGVLLEELPQHGIEIGDMRVVVAGSNVTLESREAILPLEDHTLFLFPKKVKSGCFSEETESANSDEEGTAANFNYEEDDVEDYEFNNGKEEAIVRVNFILQGNEKLKYHAERVLELLGVENSQTASTPGEEVDPDTKRLADEASRLAGSFI